MIELSGPNSCVQSHDVHVGGSSPTVCSAETLGLTLAQAKEILVGLQRDLVQAKRRNTARAAAAARAVAHNDH
jgi:hypothetical protein